MGKSDRVRLSWVTFCQRKPRCGTEKGDPDGRAASRRQAVAQYLLRRGMGGAPGDDRGRSVSSLARGRERLAAAHLLRADYRLACVPADRAPDAAAVAPGAPRAVRGPELPHL